MNLVLSSKRSNYFINQNSNLVPIVLNNSFSFEDFLVFNMGNNCNLILPPCNLIVNNTIKIRDLKNVCFTGSIENNSIRTNVFLNGGHSLFEIINSENILFQNLNLIGPHSYFKESVGIMFKHCDSVRVNRCNIKNFGRSGIEFFYSNGLVNQSIISFSLMKDTSGWKNDLGTRKNMGYGVNVNSSQVKVSRSLIEKCSHAIASSGINVHYNFTTNLVRQCGLNLLPFGDLELNGHAIDTHANHEGTFHIARNLIYKTNVGIWLRGGNGSVEDNYFINCNEGVRVGPTYSEYNNLLKLGQPSKRQSVNFSENYFDDIFEDKKITLVNYDS